MQTETNLPHPAKMPMLSAESLRRPLTDEEKREIWGDYASGMSPEILQELADALRECDEEEREIVEAWFQALIFQKMAAYLLDRHNGALYKSIDSIEKTVDGFNRILR